MAEYTDPELRQRLKEELQAGDKGGRPGQWSARKAQLLVQAYERAGGGYVGERDERQQHLHDWGEEHWQTADGSARARGADGTARYLPAEAWEQLTPAQRRATDARKRGADRQVVENTPAAKGARRRASKPLPGYDELTAREVAGALGDLGPAKLRAVRDYERAHRARKTVLERVERALR